MKMGAVKPVQMLRAGLPSTLSTLGHAVQTLMGFAPLFELPGEAMGAKMWTTENLDWIWKYAGILHFANVFHAKGLQMLEEQTMV